MPGPEQNKLRQSIETSSPDRFRAIFSQWISMPRYDPGNEDYSLLESISDPKRSPAVEAFLTKLREDVGKRIESDDYGKAVDILANAYEQAVQNFSGDLITTLHRFIWYRSGFVHEHRATYGDLSKKPLGDKDRTACFLKAATCYMQADIVLGYVSDYGLRVSESLGGAGPLYGEFSMRAITKLFGNDVIVIGPNDNAGRAAVKDLKRRSKNVRKEIVPGGGDMHLVSKEDLPPEDSN